MLRPLSPFHQSHLRITKILIRARHTPLTIIGNKVETVVVVSAPTLQRFWVHIISNDKLIYLLWLWTLSHQILKFKSLLMLSGELYFLDCWGGHGGAHLARAVISVRHGGKDDLLNASELLLAKRWLLWLLLFGWLNHMLWKQLFQLLHFKLQIAQLALIYLPHRALTPRCRRLHPFLFRKRRGFGLYYWL